MSSLPVHPIDLRRWHQGGPAERRALARLVDEACRDTGFLLLTGHGVPDALSTGLLDAFGAFFDLPAEEKRRWIVDDPGANLGYSEPGREALAYSLGQETPPDLFESYCVGREDVDPGYAAAHPAFFPPNLWPDLPAHLPETWRAYERSVRDVADVLLRAMALALGLPEAWLVDRNHRAVMTTKANDYRRAAGAPDPEPGQMRLGAHTDYGILTLLTADDVPGLQVCRGGVWQDVTVPPGALLCNIGDLLERWTNDRWSSTLHRVVPPPPSQEGEVRRRSVAWFLDCEPDMVVECIPSCSGPDDPPRYPPVVAGRWLMAKVVGGRDRTPAQLPGA